VLSRRGLDKYIGTPKTRPARKKTSKKKK